jgi:hypothetical protein
VDQSVSPKRGLSSSSRLGDPVEWEKRKKHDVIETDASNTMSKIKAFLKALALLLSALCVLLLIFMGWVKYRSLGSNPEGLPLAVR